MMHRSLLFPFSFLLLACNQPGRNPAEQDTVVAVSRQTIQPVPTGKDGPLATDTAHFSASLDKTIRRARKEHFSLRYALLADLGLHSGSKRIFLVDLRRRRVLHAGLVTHGSSTTYQPAGTRLYSNIDGTLCSSLGMYRIGLPYQGQFGLAYKLHGLDQENSHAYARAIVFHSHACVPDRETRDPICQSWGCPTVSPAFLKTLAGYIDAADKPLLLYVFDSVEDHPGR